ncbi:MAG: TM2 domain-containing protein [Eubacteriaceae bacterium]|nr:TM2 domain-containing protein [Eubacteriaceae bacterium]MBR2781094.1 TM2 domain-containing protein [Eubacteriaceae bacterium]MCR4894267.1 TM2 domain-containing protein [Eubacteriales bacterium]
MKYCTNCGAVMGDQARFCENCGKQADGTERRAGADYDSRSTPAYYGGTQSFRVGSLKNKWVTLGLCFFLGVIGVHKFYEGKIVWGLVYLFTGGLAGIGWIYDMVKILMIPDTYYYVYR